MVRETRHLWVGNLPDNIREERILEHFKRYGRVQSVKLLAKKDEENGVCATVAFIDIKSASKAQSAENKIDECTLKTDYYEPTTPSTASSAIHIHERDDSLLRTHPGPGLYPPPPARNQRYSHGLPEERAYDRSSHYYERAPERDAYMRRSMSYHEDELYQGRGRPRERAFRGGATAAGYQAPVDRAQTHFRSHNTRQHFDQPRYPPAEQYGEDRDSSSGRLSRRSSPGRTKTRKNRSCSHSGSESRSGSQSSSGTRSSSSSTDSRSSSSSSESSQSQSQSESRSKSRSRSPSWSSSKAGRGSDKPSSVASTPVPQLQSAVSTPVSANLCTTIGNASFNNSNSMDSTTCDKEDKRHLGICVRNLPVRSSDTSLKDGLFHEYKKHGKVTMVKVIGQGTERYAVVCFKKPEDVEKAMEVSKDKLFFGSKIEVTLYEGMDVDDNEFRPLEAELDEYHPKATRTLFIGNLEKDITAAELRKHFEQFGEIIEIDIKKQGAVSSYAFVQYSDISSVVKAMRKMDGEHLGANRIKLGFGKSMPTTCVWLDGIADTVTEKFLARQFHRFGPVSYTVVDREKGHALIFYDRMEYAQAAVTEMRGRALGGKKLQIDFASRECQMAFYEKMEMTGQQIPTDRPWDRREQNFDGRDDREIRIGYENHGRGYTRFDSNQRGRGTFRGTQRGTFTNRGRGTQVFTNRYETYHKEYADRPHRVVDDDYSQGSGASYDDSYEQELRDYGVSQRERRDYSGEDRSTRDRSFSPVRKVERSLSPHDRIHDDRSISPPTSRIVETQRRSERSFDRYDSGREEEGTDDKKSKYYGMLLRRKQRQRSVSDQDSFHSQSPPNSRHHSRSASPPVMHVDQRLKEKMSLRPRSPGTPTDSPSRESPFDPALDRDSYVEMFDSMKRKLPEGKSDLRDLLPKGGQSLFENVCNVNSSDLNTVRPRTKVELDRSRFRKVHSAPCEEDCKTDLADYPSEMRRASLASLDGELGVRPPCVSATKEHRTMSRLPEGGKLQSVVSCISRLPRPVPVDSSSERNKVEVSSSLPPLGESGPQQMTDKRDAECGELVEETAVNRPVTTDKDLTNLQNKKVQLLHLIEQLDASGSSGDDDHGLVLGGLLNEAGRFPPSKRPRLSDVKLSKENIRSLLEIGRDTKEVLLPPLDSIPLDVDPGKPADPGPHRKTVPADVGKVLSRGSHPSKAKRPPLERMEVLRGSSVSSMEGDSGHDPMLELTCKRPKHGLGLQHDDLTGFSTGPAKQHLHLHHQAKLREGLSLEVTYVVSGVDDELSSTDKYSSSKVLRPPLHHSIPPLLTKSGIEAKPGSLGDEPKRDRECPLSLPLPRFANAVLSPKHSPKQLLSPKLGNIKSPPPPPPLPSPHRRHSISLSPSLTSPSSSAPNLLHRDGARTTESGTATTNALPATPTSPSSNALPAAESPDPVKESPQESGKVECSPPTKPPLKSVSPKVAAGCKGELSSSDSEHSPLSSPTRLSLEERIRMLDEKYNAWSGSAPSLSSASIGGSTESSTSSVGPTTTTAASTTSTTSTTTTKIDYEKYTIKRRPMLLSTEIARSEPSEIVKSLLAKSSIFDQDSKRLEHINEKYEPKDLPPPESVPKVNRCFRTKAAAKEFFSVQSQPESGSSKLGTTFPNSILCKQQSLPTSLMTTTSVLTTTSPSQIHSATALAMSCVSTMPSVTTPIPSSSSLPTMLQNPPFLPLSQSLVPFSPRPNTPAIENTPKASSMLPRKSSDPNKPSLKRDVSAPSSCAVSPSSSLGKASSSPLHASAGSSILPCGLASPASKKECPPIPSPVQPKKELHGILVKREPKEPVKECKREQPSNRDAVCKDQVKKEDGPKCGLPPKDCGTGRKESFCATKDLNSQIGQKRDLPSCSKDGHSKNVPGCTSSKDSTGCRKDGPSVGSCKEVTVKKEPNVKKEPFQGPASKEVHSVKKEAPSQVSIANKKRVTSTDSTESESGKSAKSDKVEHKAEKEAAKVKTEARSAEPESKKLKLSGGSVEERCKKSGNPNHANPGSVNKKSSKSPTSNVPKTANPGKSERKEEKKPGGDPKTSDDVDRERARSSGNKPPSKEKEEKKSKTTEKKDGGADPSKSKTKSENSSSKSENSSSKSKESEKKGKDEKKKKDKDRDKSKEKKNSSDKSKNENKADKKMESLFAFVDDGPIYFSMYDKVKARSSQNEKAKEKEKELETVREKFSQLKQSRAKREEKCKSTSVEYNSDRGSEGGSSRHSTETSESKTSSKGKQAKKRKLVIESSSSDEETSKEERKYSKRGSHHQRKKSEPHVGSSGHPDDSGDAEMLLHDCPAAKDQLPSTSSRKEKHGAAESGRRIRSDVDSSDDEMRSTPPPVGGLHASPIMEQTSGKKQKSKGRKKQEKEQCKKKTAKKKSPRSGGAVDDNSDAETGAPPRVKSGHASKSSKMKKAKAMMMMLATEPRTEEHTSDSDVPVAPKRSPASHRPSSQNAPKERHEIETDGHPKGAKMPSASKPAKKERRKKEHQMKFARLDSSDGEAPAAADEQPVVKKRKNKTSKKEKSVGDKSRNKTSKEGGGSRLQARDALKSDDEGSFVPESCLPKMPDWKDGDARATKGDYDFVVGKSDDERPTNFRRRHRSIDDEKLAESKDMDSWLESIQHPSAHDSYPYMPSPVGARLPKDEPSFDKLESNPFDFYSDVEVDVPLPKKEEKRKKNKKDKNKEKRRRSKTESDKSKESTKSKGSSVAAVAPESREEYASLSISDHDGDEYSSKKYSQLEEAVKALEWHLQEIHDKSPHDGAVDDRGHVSLCPELSLPPTHCYPNEFGLGTKDRTGDSRRASGGQRAKDKLCSVYDVFDFKEEGSSDVVETAMENFSCFAGDSKEQSAEPDPKCKRPRKKRKKSRDERPKRTKLDPKELHELLACASEDVPDVCDSSHSLAAFLEAEPPKEEEPMPDLPSPKSTPPLSTDTLPLAVVAAAAEPAERAKSAVDDFIPELLESTECLQESEMEPLHVADKCEPDHLDLVEEKGTAISQEETEDAVKALLGETFGGECFDPSHSGLLDEHDDKMDACDDPKDMRDHDDNSLYALEMLGGAAKELDDAYDDEKVDAALQQPPPLVPTHDPPSSPPVEPEATFDESFGREPDMEPLTTPSSEGDQLVIDEHPSPAPDAKDEAVDDEGISEAVAATEPVTPYAVDVTPAPCESPASPDVPKLDPIAFAPSPPQPEAAPESNVDEEEKRTSSSDEVRLPTPDALDMPLLETNLEKTEKPDYVSFELSSVSETKPRKGRRGKTRKYSEPGLESHKVLDAAPAGPEAPAPGTPPRHGGCKRSRPVSVVVRRRRGSRTNFEDALPEFAVEELLPEAEKITDEQPAAEEDYDKETKPVLEDGGTMQEIVELVAKNVPEELESSEIPVVTENPVNEAEPPEFFGPVPDEEVKEPPSETSSALPEDDVKPLEDDVKPPEDDVKPPEDDVKPPEDDVKPPEDDVKPLEDDVKPPEEQKEQPVLKVAPLTVSTLCVDVPPVVSIVLPPLVSPIVVKSMDKQEVGKQEEPKKARRGRKKKCENMPISPSSFDKGEANRPDDKEEQHHHQRESRSKSSHLEVRSASELRHSKETKSPFDVFEFRDEEDEDIVIFENRKFGDHGPRHGDDKKFAVPAAVDNCGGHEHEGVVAAASGPAEPQHHLKEEREVTAVERSRPRLILTIKSPHKDSHERVPKVETREEPPLRFAEPKAVEEPHCEPTGDAVAPANSDPPQSNTSPGRSGATRKSQRLQEKSNRTTIDETIEDVVKGHCRSLDGATTSSENEQQSVATVTRRTRSRARAEEAANSAAATLPVVAESETAFHHAGGSVSHKTESHTENSNSSESSTADPKVCVEHGAEGLKPVSLRTFRITRTQARSEAGKQVLEPVAVVVEVEKPQHDRLAEEEDGGRAQAKEDAGSKSPGGHRPADESATANAARDKPVANEVHNNSTVPEVCSVGSTRNSVIDKSSAITPLQGQLVMKVELPKVATNLTAGQKPDGPVSTVAVEGAKKESSEPEPCPTALVDPVTGFLTPVRQSEEGTYVPAAATEEQRAAAAKRLAQGSVVTSANQPLALGPKPVAGTVSPTSTEKPVVAVGPPPLIPSKPSSVETSVVTTTSAVTLSAALLDRGLTAASQLTPQMTGQPLVASDVTVIAAYDQQAVIQARIRSHSLPHVQQVSSGYVGEPPVDVSARARASSVPSIPPPLTPVLPQALTSAGRDMVVVDQKVVPVSRTSSALAAHRGVPVQMVNPNLQNQIQSQIAQPMPSIRPLAWPTTINPHPQSAVSSQNIPPLTQVPSPRPGPPAAHSTLSTMKSSAGAILQQPSLISVVSGSREMAKSALPASCNPPIASVMPPGSNIKLTAPLKIHVVQPPVRASDIPTISLKTTIPSSVVARDRKSPVTNKSDVRTLPQVNPSPKQPQTDAGNHPRVNVSDVSIGASNLLPGVHGASRVSEGAFADVTRGPTVGAVGMPSPVGQVAKAQQQIQGGASSPKGNVAPRHSPVVLQQASYPMASYEAALQAYGPTAAGGVTIAELLQNSQYVVQHKDYLAAHHGSAQMMPGQLVRPGTPVAVHPDLAARLGNPTPPHTPTPPSHPSLTAQGDIALHLRHPNVLVQAHHPHMGIRHPVDMPPYMHQPLVYAHPHYGALHPELRAQQEAQARAAVALNARVQFNVRHPDARVDVKCEGKPVVSENHPASNKTQQQQPSDSAVMVKEEKSIGDHPCRDDAPREGRRSHAASGIDVSVMQPQQLVDAMSATRGKVVPPCPAAALHQSQAQFTVGLSHMQRQIVPLVSVSPHERATDSPAVANLYNQSQARTPAHNATASYQPDAQAALLGRAEQAVSSNRHSQQLQKLPQGAAHGNPHDSKGVENAVISNHPSAHQHPNLAGHSMEATQAQHRTAVALASSTPVMYPPTSHIQQHRSVPLVKQEATISRVESRPPDAHRPLKTRSPLQSTMRTVSPPPAHSRLAVVGNVGVISQHAATGQILPPAGGGHLMPQPGSEAPQHAVPHGLTQSVVQSRVQLQTPPHASQVPPQGDSLLMLLQRYPIMWQGLLALKNDQAVVQMHFVSGNPHVARASLPAMSEGGTPPLRIAQRMRLEQTQLEGVVRRMQMEGEHCMLLALPCGRDHMDVLQQSNNLRNGFITYLQQKQAAGIVNVAVPGSQQPAYVVHIFPSCEFSNENLNRIAPDLLHSVTDIAHLLIVIATV